MVMAKFLQSIIPACPERTGTRKVMSIQKKLVTIIVIVGCAAVIATSFLLWSTYTLQHKAEFVSPALNYLESVAKTSTFISNQRRVASDYLVTDTAAARQEFEKYSTSIDLGFQEWRRAIQEQKLLGIPGEAEDLTNQIFLERKYDEWRKETRAVIDRKHVASGSKHGRDHLNLPSDDAILALMDSSLEDGIEEIHWAYHNLLMSMGAFPWLVMTSTQQMESAHIAIDYYVAVIRTADSLNKQLKELLNYLHSGEVDHLEKIARTGIQTEDALAKWSESINRKYHLDNKDDNEGSLLLKSVISSHVQTESLIDLIVKRKQAGNDAEAVRLVKSHLQILLDKQLLPAVSLAKSDSKQEINNVSNKLIETAKAAVWQGLAAVIFVTLLITALVFRLMKMLTASITQIQSGIESIGTGNLDNRLNPQTSDEFGTLAASLDAMTERLQQSYNENTRLNARLEKQVTQLETANREIESFSYMVSHDLRNPVTAIGCYAEMMLKESARSMNAHSSQYLEKILNTSKRLSDLIEDIMLLARVTHMEIVTEELDASKIADRIMGELIQQAPDRKVDFLCQPDIHVRGSSQLITILLENILGNAWKYSSTMEQTVIEFGQLWKDGEQVCFVRDNGVGFSNADAQKIFVAFERLHSSSHEFEGTGIGLAIAKKIVNCHHGRIWAESAVGEGAVFYFSLAET
ncbi:MAG: hypothetical protein CXR30_17095 [Geobacter sp.]|nr:MAG: hypothetical protein CXR30_17095 [Geobacter sp.]